MPWCPKCRNEYVEGITVCADCGCELVETLEETQKEPLTFGKEEEITPIFLFLKASHFATVAMKEAAEPGLYELYVAAKEREKAERTVGIYYQQEALKKQAGQEDCTDEKAAETQKAVLHASAGVYQKTSEKAEEFRSSAYVLIAVSLCGVVGLVLLNMGVLPIRLAAFNKYLINGVMGAMFLLFFVMGVLSIRSSRVLSVKAKKEDELTREILNWCRENLRAEQIDAGLSDSAGDDAAGEEVKYFKRTRKMTERITSQFINLDEAYVEQLVDDYYQEVFPE